MFQSIKHDVCAYTCSCISPCSTVVLSLFKSSSGPATSVSASTSTDTTGACATGEDGELMTEVEERGPEAREEGREGRSAGVAEMRQLSNGAGGFTRPKHPLAKSVWTTYSGISLTET